MSKSKETIVLPEEFTLGSLADLHSRVSCLMQEGLSFTFDGTGVHSIDGAAVQFLVMCQCHLPSLEDELLVASGYCVNEGIRDLGFDSLIGPPTPGQAA